MSGPKTIDLFSGVGGFSLGFSLAEFDVALAVDKNETTLETYRRNFPDKRAVNIDLSQADGEDILAETSLEKGDVDVVIGGPPCQGFSVMGNRDKDDERNGLLLHFARQVVDIAPRYFVMENVKGLNSGDAKDYLERFEETLDSAGFGIVEPLKVLNAKNYGVPQDRERLIVIGYREGEIKPPYPEPINEKTGVRDAIGDIPSNLDSQQIENGVLKSELGEPSPYVRRLNSWKNGSRNLPNGLSGMQPVDHEERIVERFSKVEPGDRDEISSYHRLDPDQPSYTLRAGSGRDRGTHTAARPIHPEDPRVITVREAARLQSFPDWFQFHQTKYHGMRQIGNSVPPLLAFRIGESILDSID